MLSKQEILAAYQFRHACKQYDPSKSISDEDFRFILECARLSPSSFGFEPWRFLVIESPVVKEIIYSTAWGAKDKINDCSRFVVILARLKSTLQADSPYITKMLREVHQIPEEAAEMRRNAYRQYCEKDADIDSNQRAFYDWACKQSYIALSNMMTAAAMIGIDSTPIEGFPYHELNEKLSAQGLYNPYEFRISVMCAFGHRAVEPREKTRQTFDDVVKWVK